VTVKITSGKIPCDQPEDRWLWRERKTEKRKGNAIKTPTSGPGSQHDDGEELQWLMIMDLTAVAAGRGRRGGIRPGRHCARGGIWRVENGIMKCCRFWQIDVCIADCDNLTP